eukprot:5273447-Pyramimonas_sp.AAC.1
MHAKPENIDLCIQRFKMSTITLETVEGHVTLKTGEGGLMGDPYAVQLFRGTFFTTADKMEIFDPAFGCPLANQLTARWRDTRAHVGGCTYADD